MPEYPDNSHSARENTSPPSKRVEKVVNGTAKTRKQSEVKKFAGIFMPDEVGDVKTFIITDVVIPGLKNAIADVVSIVLFGEAGRIGTRKNAGSKVSYQRYYDDPRRDDRRNYNLLQDLSSTTSSSTTVEMQTSSSTSWNPLLPTMAWPACWISMTSPDLLARITWLISTAGLIFRVPELPERGTATSCSFPEQSKSPKKRCGHVRIFCLKRVQRLRRRNMDAVPD